LPGRSFRIYYPEVTSITGLLHIAAHIFDPFRKLRSLWHWDKAMDINPEDEMTYITHYQEACLKYVENEYCAKHRRMSVTKPEYNQQSYIILSANAAVFGQSSFDPYDLSSDDDEYLMCKCVAETTPWRSHCAPLLLTTAMLYLHSPPESPNNWGQVNPNVSDYDSDPMEISSTYLLRDITDWWRQQEERHSNYADLSNVACTIFSFIPHGVRMEASFFLP
jgi:hypothetical protein